MAYILGTAGHVDHGKTALVKCLTGIETSHIPEEKKRGMTIELGFASLHDPVYGTVGIVDVPGHERFIRNMVAGTWGLDAALLIVAADDGWMQMSADHLRVLKAMHITAILLVITKADLVDEALLALVQEESLEQCQTILGRTIPSVAVSSLTGFGIEALKQQITTLLATVQPVQLDTPFLYVDRAFTLKGIGTTVTGTLRGQKLTVGDTLALYPGTAECRIKGIQNHHTDVESAEAGMRTALNIKLAEKAEIKRGMLLVRGGLNKNALLQGSEMLIRIDETFKIDEKTAGIKNHSELEIAAGSAHAIGSIHINKTDTSLARLSLQEPLACRWNQPAVLIRHGGSSILASCRILAAFATYDYAAFKPLFALYAGRELPSWKSFQFYYNGYIEKKAAEQHELVFDEHDILLSGSWWFAVQKLLGWEQRIMSLAQKSQAGFSVEEVDIALPVPVKLEILKKLCSAHKLTQAGAVYTAAGQGENLSKTARQLLDLALKAGFEGIAVDKLTLPQVRKDARDLVKLGKLVVLEDFLHYHRQWYEKAAAAILQGKKAGDAFTIADARAASGLSRKYIIPLLNVMEKEGKVARRDNDRIVL